MFNGPGPNGCHYHITAMIGSKLFVFGGLSGGKSLNDMWALDLSSRTIARRFSKPF